MKTITNNLNKNILRKKPSINTSRYYTRSLTEAASNTSTDNFQNKKAWPLNGQCQIGEVVCEGNLLSNQPNYKEKSIFGLRKNLSKGAYTATIYLSKVNFMNTTQRNSGKSR